MPTIQQLRVFASIARFGNLGEAAESVCLSRGAVSQALGELERRLGTPVFDRVHPRLRLNEQGRQLQPLAEDLLDRMEDIRHLFDKGGEPAGKLRIGASQTIGNYLLPLLLAGQNGLEAQVLIANTHDLCEQLSRFELDLALIEGHNHDPDLSTELWREDEMLLVASAKHPLASKEAVSLSDLEGCSWVLREPHSGSREQFDQELASRLSNPGYVLELNSIEALLLAVEQNIGLTLISRLAVENRLESGRLIRLPFERKFGRTLHLVWHRQKFHSALMRRFTDFCRQNV